MLSASILGQGLIHSLGSSEIFFSLYKDRIKENTFVSQTSVDVSGLSNMLPGVSLRRVPKYARMGLMAALEALNNANLPIPDVNRLGLVVGTAFSGAQMNIDFMDSILEASPQLSSPTAFSHAVNNMGAGLLSLFLNIRGGCQTITQFDLSFAGALQVALLLLASNKNDYVLLGALDENDARFIETCPQELQRTPYPHSEGAVFFLLGKSIPNTAQISLSWHDTIPTANNIVCSGDLNKNNHINNASFYGTSPIAQALDTALAVYFGTEETLCVCKEKNIEQMAAINIRK